MTPGAEIEPGPHWWTAGALTTRLTLPHPVYSCKIFHFENKFAFHWHKFYYQPDQLSGSSKLLPSR